MARNGGFRLSLKFLVSNGLAGSLIGTAGATIKELIEVTEARVTVSSLTDVYPGTSERIILISGNEAAVDAAQTLVWEMIGSNIKANGDKTVTWSPRLSAEAPGEFDDISVVGKISIPASAGGLILGRGGASLRAIADESGAHIQMTSIQESIFTQERVLTISGTTGVCAKCVSMVLAKLAQDLEAAQYINRGVTYSAHLGGALIPAGGTGADPRSRGGRGGRGGASSQQQAAASELIANTTITLNIPDSLVGNILGRQGSTMREIMSLSGAKIVVSPRGEYEEGTTNRVVTITGTPQSAQTAHVFVTQKLQQQPGPSRPRRVAQEEA